MVCKTNVTTASSNLKKKKTPVEQKTSKTASIYSVFHNKVSSENDAQNAVFDAGN